MPARPPLADLPPSPALSILANGPESFAGRKFGVLITDGTDAGLLSALQDAASAEGALVELVAPRIGGVVTSDGELVPAHQTVDGGPSVLFDAIALDTYGAVDVRIGPNPTPWSIAEWENASSRIDVPAPHAPGAYRLEAPVAGWAGQEVIIAARTANPRGRYSDWSNLFGLTVIDPLAAPTGLRGAGPFVQVRSVDHPVRYRVYAGAYADANEAAYLAELLAREGESLAPLIERTGRHIE